MALSALDEHFAGQRTDRVERAGRRRHGLANIRLIRYADDFAIMVSGTRAHAEALLDEVAEVLSRLGLRLAPNKTGALHIDEGLDYTYPTKKAVRSCAAKANLPLEVLLHQLNSLLRGWTTYFRPCRQRGPDRPGEGANHPLPIPGNSDPYLLAEHSMK